MARKCGHTKHDPRLRNSFFDCNRTVGKGEEFCAKHQKEIDAINAAKTAEKEKDEMA